MNIFVLDQDPEEAAKKLKWGHVNKMIVESTQMLSNVLPKSTAPYKRTHYNHPCSIWVRESYENFMWLVNHALVLCKIYEERQAREHACLQVICYIERTVNICPTDFFLYDALTPFATAMPQRYVIPGNPVQSYIDYYASEKQHIKD